MSDDRCNSIDAIMRREPLYKGDPAFLLSRIAAFSPNKSGTLKPFSQRLAAEQGWSAEFTSLAIREYKRFVYLAAVADHRVTPSLVVDEVWHLHLIYTRSYWEELGDILGFLFHHEPGSGEEEENAAFVAQYRLTVESYRRYFGDPPVEIWGCGNGRNVRRSARPEFSKEKHGDNDSRSRSGCFSVGLSDAFLQQEQGHIGPANEEYH